MTDVNTRPRYIMGQEYGQGEFPTQSQYPSGAFSAFSRSFMGAIPDVTRRWVSVFDEEETLTEDQFKEVVGDRPVEYYSGMDKSTAEFLAWEHDRDQQLAQYEARPIAEFLGMMLPYVADPVSVATLPVGGTSVARALSSASLKQFVKHSVTAGAKVGAASAPLEAAIQPSAYGEIRPELIAGTALGPVIASPLLSAPGYALRGVRGRTGAQVARAAQPETNMGADFFRAINNYQQDNWGVKRPPEMPRPDKVQLPSARFNEMFDSYPGGVKQWVRDLAADNEAAINHIKKQGIDSDAPPLRNFIIRHKEGSAKRAQFVGLEERFTQLRDVTDMAQGRARPEQIERLRKAGILEEVREMQEALEREGFQRTAEDTRRLRQVEGVAKELEQLETNPVFAELAEALRKPGFQRTAQDLNKINDFMRRGADGEMAARIEKLRTDYDNAVKNLRDLEEKIASRKGRKPKKLLDERKTLENQVHALAEEQDLLRNKLRGADGDVRVEDLMAAMDAASLESAITPRRSRVSSEIETRPSRQIKADPEEAELEKFARDFGIDPEEARNFAESLFARIEDC